MNQVVLGEKYVAGVAVEGTRGEFASPQDFVRAREPFGVQTVVDKVDRQETEGTGLATKGQDVTMKRVSGDGAVNLRFRTYGYWLLSLFGSVSSAEETGETGNGVYRHTFTVDPNALQPTLSVAMARGDFAHKGINGAVVSQINETYPTDDYINSTISLMGRTESDQSDFTPAFSDDDHIAPHQYATFKIADTENDLDSADPICVRSITNEMNRNTREKTCVSDDTVKDFVAQLLSLTGNFEWDKTSDEYRDLGIANGEKAMRISIVNTSVTIGSAANPSLIYTFPRVTFNTEESRPIDDTVTETVNWVAHGVSASLINEKENYNAAA